MRQIVSACFPKAMITLDRFHHQQFCLEALQEIRIGHRRESMTKAANARDGFGAMIKDLAESGKPFVDAEGNPIRSDAAYHPERLKNNETKAKLFIRSRYLLMVSPEKWTASQRERAEILFELYPDIEKAYSLTHSLRMIFAQKCDKEAGRRSIKKWYAKVGEFDNKAFNDIAAAMYDREDEILNYFVNRSTNASAESLNAKIKDFCLLTHQMFDGCNWMVDNHSWPRPSHYHSDTLFHLWSIAMHRTFLAGGLLLAKTASVESAVGIVQQILATWA